MKYEYRMLFSPGDLRPGERLVQMTVSTGSRAWQGDRELLPPERVRYFAERAVPFQSRFKSERYR